jgi:hypothetical protein
MLLYDFLIYKYDAGLIMDTWLEPIIRPIQRRKIYSILPDNYKPKPF